MTLSVQLLASDPKDNAAVRANAGSGKTWTLVARVARLLLHGARPEAILCVTYTKAAAAEMQRRLFADIGDWSVLPDADLRSKLADLDERPGDLAEARKLFARALETPGGLKIQTIHAFCEKLLRRFPLEAEVSPGFTVLEDAAAAQASARARDLLAHAALADEDGPVGAAYGRMSVQADDRAFQAMLKGFESRRHALQAYFDRFADRDAMAQDVWRLCGFNDGPVEDGEIEAEALADLDRDTWRRARDVLAAGSATDQGRAEKISAVLAGEGGFAAALKLVVTGQGEAATWVAKAAVIKREPALQAALQIEQDRLIEAGRAVTAAAMARDSVAMLTLAVVYCGLYRAEKERARGLDFDDLISASCRLLTHSAGAAAWVLFKLDGGVDHVLVDEAQDTAPAQWDILRALTDEFFAGSGARDGALKSPRTVFFVGDEKQSIYSFQGAKPERLLQESQAFSQAAAAVGAQFPQIDLLVSRRSRPEVLAFVDAVALQPGVTQGLRPGDPGDDIIRHEAHRGGGGCVDLWPLETGDPKPTSDPWLPVDAASIDSGAKKLARRIAAEIKALIGRDGVEDGAGTRPASAGDVLILVRRRNALFEEIIRALKQAQVPVAGADRLKLSDHVAFQDLLAVARFCLFPDDDLTLAALLRSPLCDVDEDGLFALAWGRSGSLWSALQRRRDEKPAFAAAVDLFTWAMGAARRLTPFDFYGALLSRMDAEGRSVRGRLLRRLGPEAADVIDEFTAQTLAAERRGIVELERFAAALSLTDLEIKREQEAGGGQVRVMTVHGAKGLEAPIVFLPDTTTAVKAMGETIMALGEEGEDGFLWAPRSADDGPAAAAARALRQQKISEEGLRLLYVGMTRARDRLVLCGVRREDRTAGFETGCWYELLEQTFAAPDLLARTITQGGLTYQRFGRDPDPTSPSEAVRPAVPASAPDWMHRLAPAEPGGLRFASPSALADAEPGSAPSPLATVGGLGRFRRGEIIHRLLQILPDVPQTSRRAAAERLLAAERDLGPGQREEMIAAAFRVLEDAVFAPVFGPGSRPEVAVAGRAAGLPGGLGLSGRIDRLVVTPDRVLVVDFKTNRPAPSRIEDADRAYILQLAAYRAMLAEVFPGRAIEAALVWTDGPKLMPLPENMMDEALAALDRGR